MIISVISFIFVFFLVVMAHELGHFFSARRAGIRVFEFAVGFGPRIFKFKKGDTTYGLNLIPLGGYVRLAGIEGRDEEEEVCPEEEKYYNKSSLQKFRAIVSGPLMNIVLAFVLLSLIFLFAGSPVGVSNEIESIVPGSPAEKIGLRPGDKIEAIDGAKVDDMASAIEKIHASAGKELSLKINRKGDIFFVNAIPKLNPNMKVGLIGFSPKPLLERVGPIKAIVLGAKQTIGMVLLIGYFIGLLITGKASVGDLAGPVGIAQYTGQAAHSGIVSLLYFTAFLSVNLGVVNLLPLPALDGGRLVFVLLEWIRRKPLPIEKENRIHHIGIALLLTLLVALTINDVVRLFRR